MLNSQAQVLHQTLVASHSSGLLLGHESDVDVGHNTTGGDGGTSHKLGELVVVTDSELDVTGDDTGSPLLTSAVSGELGADGQFFRRGTGGQHGLICSRLSSKLPFLF